MARGYDTEYEAQLAEVHVNTTRGLVKKYGNFSDLVGDPINYGRRYRKSAGKLAHRRAIYAMIDAGNRGYNRPGSQQR